MTHHRRIPVLPGRPEPIQSRAGFHAPIRWAARASRACAGGVVLLTITTQVSSHRAYRHHVSTPNSSGLDDWTTRPFVQTYARTLVCRMPSGRPGVKSFRAEFSLDGGATWSADTVPDAWILIDPPQVLVGAEDDNADSARFSLMLRLDRRGGWRRLDPGLGLGFGVVCALVRLLHKLSDFTLERPEVPCDAPCQPKTVRRQLIPPLSDRCITLGVSDTQGAFISGGPISSCGSPACPGRAR
ncbi:hypothetical protein BH11PLA1_BH11PLA1_00740 [soil metagenome]